MSDKSSARHGFEAGENTAIDLPPKNLSRVILLIAVVVAVIVFIIRNVEATKNILLVLLGFGAVVLIHEFGHFVVAKLCGIKVEAFSIGFPPVLLGIKKADRGWRIRILPELFRKEAKSFDKAQDKQGREDQVGEEEMFSFTFGKKILPGETEYRIGLIPFGGFVKMLGQDDVGPTVESKDPRSYANKPALLRAAVLAAGVTFNAISAAVMFVVVFLVGINLLAPVVGDVMPGSPAQRAGIRPDDEIIQINGQEGRLDFSDIVMAAVLSGKSEEIPLKVRHADGTVEEVKLAAEKLPETPYRSFGIERPSNLTVAKLDAKDANLLKVATGLMPGDRIKAVDGVDVNSNWQFANVVESTFEPNAVLLAERRDSSGQTQLVEAKLELRFPEPRIIGKESEKDLSNICGMVPRLRIVGASRTFTDWLRGVLRLPDRENRLKAGDIIVGLADVNDPTYAEMREITTAYKAKDLPVTVIRTDAKGVQKRLTVIVVPKEDKDLNRVMIGLAVVLDVEHPIVAKTIATPQNPEASQIPRGAAITAVDGVNVKSFFDVARVLKKNAGQRVTIDWRIDAQNAGNTVIVVDKNEKIADVQAVSVEVVPFKQVERLYKADGPIDAMRMGYKRTKMFIIQSYLTVHRLISGLVSPKELMGPVGILTVSYKIVADQPLIYYVYFLGLISASLAVLNFLPMPPLDGGLTLLLLIEKIKGSAISIRTQEIIAYVGWGLVGALLLYVTFNDIVRLILG